MDSGNSGVDERVLNAIIAFRAGLVIVHPGGGGQYGRVELSETTQEENNNTEPQKSLFEF